MPQNIRLNRELNLSAPLSKINQHIFVSPDYMILITFNRPYKAEQEFLEYAKETASLNKIFRSYIGMGYSNCHIPPVIVRNVFENPGW